MRASLYSLIVIIIIYSNAGHAKPADSDLVVPVGNAQDDIALPNPKLNAQEDAIQARKLKEGEVSEDAAQSRSVPQPDTEHTYVVPNFNYEDDGATESAANNISTKVKAPPPLAGASKKYASFRVGAYYPNNLAGDVPGITFENVYGNNNVPMFLADMEWYLWHTVGKLGLKAGLGFFTAQGDGRFVNQPLLQSDEILNLFVFPISAGLDYHAQFWDRQIIVPYGELGVDYFTMFEIRSDAVAITEGKYGGSAAAHFAAGAQIQLDFLDRAGLFHMHQEYGINHIYLTAGVREFFQLSGIYDFSAVMFEGGFGFEF